MEDLRKCNICKQEYPATLDYFAIERTKCGLTTRCRRCIRELTRKRYKLKLESDPEYLKSKRREYREKNPGYRRKYYDENRLAALTNGREHHLKRKYGLTEEDFNFAREQQKFCCWICGKHENTFKRGRFEKLVVDHDHETKELRGLLCDPCNNMLGRARDNIETLQKAIEYLKNPPGIPKVNKEQNEKEESALAG